MIAGGSIRATRTTRAVLAALAVCGACAAVPTHAAIFGDDEARKAIIDLRQRVDQLVEQDRARAAEQQAQLNDLKRSILELNNQLELQRTDNAKLRGQVEQLARDLAEVQRKQADMAQGVEDRIRRIEPQKVTLDDKEFLAEPDEKRTYDDSLAAVRRSEFDKAATGLSTLLKRWPASGYRESALFWLGNAQYGQRNYQAAIGSFRQLVSTAPESPRAPEALLAIANCQAELKDTRSARRTIEELLRTYPKSEAAAAGRERLVSLK
ncbi:MAG TPA: tol-pal system protein YbgF [Caldimonas sp.]|nr:tol-pal system protein YbgF [Caldimonas sp.]